MRDIKFRGKRTYGNHDWVFGSFVTGGIFGGPKEDCYIFFDGHFIEVIPETVGQYTGIEDKDEIEIFEDDILKIAGRVLRVIFDNGSFLTPAGISRYRLGGWGREIVKKIGNIHDNPELLNPAQGNGPLNTMQNFDPKEQAEEVKEQATEIEQAPEVTGQAAENAEEGTTEG